MTSFQEVLAEDWSEWDRLNDKRCETCRWWIYNQDYANYQSPEPGTLNHYCDAVHQDKSKARVSRGDEDNDFSCSDLFTSPNFYCSEWQLNVQK